MDQRRNHSLGAWGEEQACLFLERQNFRIVDRNYHATVGEIDIVATKGSDFYFIEVKTRMVGELANDLAVTPAKIHKFKKTVRQYCFCKHVGEVGMSLASLLVVVDRLSGRVQFRLAMLY